MDIKLELNIQKLEDKVESLRETDVAINKDIDDLKDGDQWYDETYVDDTKHKEDV